MAYIAAHSWTEINPLREEGVWVSCGDNFLVVFAAVGGQGRGRRGAVKPSQLFEDFLLDERHDVFYFSILSQICLMGRDG